MTATDPNTPEQTPKPEAPVYDQRATFYFSADMLLDLDVLMLQLRTKFRKKVGKSELARMALNMLLTTPLAEVAAKVEEEK